MKTGNLALLAVFLLLGINVSELNAEITLPSIFGDNMVLQQNSEAPLWGMANPGSTVKITSSWNNRTYTTRSGSDGSWKIKVSTPLAGGPYKIVISDGKPLTLSNVLIGEVWICSGQSNMFMPLRGFKNQPVIGSVEYIVTSANPEIRLITVPPKASLTHENDFDGKWEECNPESVSSFSATAYFFGRMLNQVLKIPVGLIQTSWGGTRIEPWMSTDGASVFDWLTIPAESSGKEEISKDLPTVIFNAMINPLAGYGIKGVIWYQGEANRNEPERYKDLLAALAQDWRQKWNIGDFPFYYAQIAPFNYGTNVNSAYLREAQLQASEVIPNSGMASLTDAGEENCIHPSNKKVAGDRLAFLALSKTYGIGGFPCEGPVLEEMTVKDNTVTLAFRNAPNGLTSYGKELSCFEVAGENRKFYPAIAYITGKGVSLFSPSVNKPVAVRYAFSDFVMGDLFSTEGLPASSFRTDNWERDR
ncbi:MAG: sialate O-acetylesterase [Bacteroidetes bacterium]|nr:MAG: sialate O-acetylesterase [Bacteroidota bacterium]